MSNAFRMVLPDHSNTRIALVKSQSRYELPQFSRTKDPLRYFTPATFNTVENANSAVFSAWGFEVTVARCLTPGENDSPCVYVMYSRSASITLPSNLANLEWIDIDQLNSIEFASDEEKKFVLEWIHTKDEPGWKRVPWSSPGWTSPALSWIKAKVKDNNAELLEEPIQLRSWATSCIFRIKTNKGIWYFKALPDSMPHEPILVEFMHRQFAQYMVAVIAVEPDKHWMITEGWEGSPPGSKAEWRRSFEALAEIQAHWNDHQTELFSCGCNDRRLANLPSQLMKVAEALKSSEGRDLYGVSEAEAKEITNRIATLPDLCTRLANCGIPETLIHGDFWGNNIIFHDKTSNKSPVIFDWADAAFSHPFLDIYMVTTAEFDLAKRADQEAAFIDFWSERYPKELVNTTYQLSLLVAPFYYMLTYGDVVMHAPRQARWELQFLVKRFARKVLELDLGRELAQQHQQ